MGKKTLTELKTELDLALKERLYFLSGKDLIEKNGAYQLLDECLVGLDMVCKDIAQLEVEIEGISMNTDRTVEPGGYNQPSLFDIDLIPINENEIPF